MALASCQVLLTALSFYSLAGLANSHTRPRHTSKRPVLASKQLGKRMASSRWWKRAIFASRFLWML